MVLLDLKTLGRSSRTYSTHAQLGLPLMLIDHHKLVVDECLTMGRQGEAHLGDRQSPTECQEEWEDADDFWKSQQEILWKPIAITVNNHNVIAMESIQPTIFHKCTLRGIQTSRRWSLVKRKNPRGSLARLALELKHAGHPRYSMDGLFHMRGWETRLSTGNLGLKVNNNYTAYAARDLMEQYPQLKGFQTHVQRPRNSVGQIRDHSHCSSLMKTSSPNKNALMS